MTDRSHLGRVAIEVVSDFDRFDALRDVWDAVVAADPAATVHATHAWLRRWWLSQRERARPRFQIARDPRGAIGVAPWVRTWKRRGGVSVWGSGLAGGQLFSRAQIAVARRERDCLTAMFEQLRPLGSWYSDLGRVPSRSVLHRFLREEAAPVVTAWRMAYQLPRADVRGGWDAYLAGRPSGFARKLRKRRATRDLSVKRFPGEIAQVGQLAQAIERVARQSWSHQEGTGLLSSASDWQFWLGTLEDSGKSGTLRANLLYDGDDPAAFIFGVVDRRTLFALKTAYAKHVAATGAGQAAVGHLVRQAAEDPGVDWVDLDCVTTHGSYKLAWASEVQQLESFYVFPRGPAARLVAGIYDRYRRHRRLSDGAPVALEGAS